MARITIEDCLTQIPNRFELTLAAANRARLLSTGAQPLLDPARDKPTVIALREVAAGKVGVEMLHKQTANKVSLAEAFSGDTLFIKPKAAPVDDEDLDDALEASEASEELAESTELTELTEPTAPTAPEATEAVEAEAEKAAEPAVAESEVVALETASPEATEPAALETAAPEMAEPMVEQETVVSEIAEPTAEPEKDESAP